MTKYELVETNEELNALGASSSIFSLVTSPSEGPQGPAGADGPSMAFNNNINGFQRFRVLADGGDGYAIFNFDTTSTSTGLPTLSVVATPEDFYVQQAASMILLDRTKINLGVGNSSIKVENTGTTVIGNISFSGTDTPGLQLKSLTTAQITTLAGASALPVGSILVDSTTDRIDARLSRGTVELVDTAGGQTIDSLKITNLLDLRKAAIANILQFSNDAFLRTDTSQLSIFSTSLARSNIALWRGGNFVVGSSTLIAASSGADATANVVDTSLSRNAAGVWQMGTTAANALGSLLLTNLTASGTVQFGATLASSVTGSPVNIITCSNLSGLNEVLIEATRAITIQGASGNGVILKRSGGVNAFRVDGVGKVYLEAETGRDVDLRVNGVSYLSVTSTGASVTGNLTASGTITANGGIVMPTSGGYIIGSGAASFSIGDVNDTIAFNAGTNLFASPLTLTSGGPLLQNNAGTIEARNNANSAYAGIRCHGLTLGSNVSFPGTAITRQISVGDAYNDGSIFQILNGATTLVSFSAANGISTGLNVSATNITASGSVFAAGSTNVYSFSSTHPVSAAPSTSWRFGSGWSGNYDTQFIFAYADNAAKVLIDTSGAITAFGGYYVNVPASSSSNIRPLQHGNSFLRFSAPASGIPGNNTTVTGWDSVILDATTGVIRNRIGGADRLVLTNTDLTLTGNLTASGQLYVGSTNNYFDNPTSGGGRWQTPFAGSFNFKAGQSGQSMIVQLETSEAKLAGLQHWDVAHANGRRLDLFSQAAVPITVRPASVLAMTWDTSGNTTAAGNLTASGTVRLGTFTVGTLPSASANTRATAYVTDSSVASFGAVATAGGALGVTVFSNGTNWIVSGGTTQPQKAITSGTAAPSGGVDGDIYLQYV